MIFDCASETTNDAKKLCLPRHTQCHIRNGKDKTTTVTCPLPKPRAQKSGYMLRIKLRIVNLGAAA